MASASSSKHPHFPKEIRDNIGSFQDFSCAVVMRVVLNARTGEERWFVSDRSVREIVLREPPPPCSRIDIHEVFRQIARLLVKVAPLARHRVQFLPPEEDPHNITNERPRGPEGEKINVSVRRFRDKYTFSISLVPSYGDYYVKYRIQYSRNWESLPGTEQYKINGEALSIEHLSECQKRKHTLDFFRSFFMSRCRDAGLDQEAGRLNGRLVIDDDARYKASLCVKRTGEHEQMLR